MPRRILPQTRSISGTIVTVDEADVESRLARFREGEEITIEVDLGDHWVTVPALVTRIRSANVRMCEEGGGFVECEGDAGRWMRRTTLEWISRAGDRAED